jgi:adenylate cyclase
MRDSRTSILGATSGGAAGRKIWPPLNTRVSAPSSSRRICPKPTPLAASSSRSATGSEEASLAFEEAIRLNPKAFDAHYLYARACFASGRIEQSASLFRRAGEVRVEDFQSMVLLAQSLRKLGRYDQAREANREGIRRAERQLDLDPTDARVLSLGANALDDDGQRDKALRWSNRALELHPNDQGVLVNGACLRARAGLVDEALELLERTFARGFGKRDWIEHDPDYDNLRGDPRFQAMLDKLR